MKITHLGHSALLVEEAGTRLLVDPGNFSDAPAIRALADLDGVLITHQHPDHADPSLLAAVLTANPQAVVYGEPQALHVLKEDQASAAFTDRLHDFRPGDEVTLAGVQVRGVGGLHAVIHPDIPRVHNTGLVLQAAGGGPRLGVTGDSLEVIEEFRGIDALAFAIVAPWSKMRETIDFLRAVAPKVALPVHDAVASSQGRAIYMKQATAHAPEGTELRDWPEGERAVTLS